MSFADICTDEEVAQLIDELGDDMLLTINGEVYEIVAQPVVESTRGSDSNGHEFNNERCVLDVSRLRLPEAATRSELKAATSSIAFVNREQRPLHISDVTDVGQRVLRLVCEP